MSNNRRKHQRLDVNLPVICQFLKAASDPGNHCLWGKAYDVSLGGMRIGLTDPANFIQAQEIHYQVNLPSPFQVFQGNGSIRWVCRDCESQRLFFGVEFTNLNHEQRDDMARIILECQAESRLTAK
ncbi:PilZ domain-containing protein [candidate division FCPU426 bacterium]|nr:PilZ domain-containing protein [candidate division FCPU426 bacterium]